MPDTTVSSQRFRRAFAGLKDWRGTLRDLRWRAVRLMAPRRVVHSRGLRLTLQCENWITHYRWQTYNDKEPETLDWIDRRLGDGETLFDIGANVGVYAIYAALRHPRMRVIAFEPEYANLHLLRDNILHNGLQERIDVYAIALSDRSGVSRLHIQDTAPGAALHTEWPGELTATLANRPVVWREGISALTLDAFCEQTGLQPTALKIDVDGTEPRILAGARHCLGSPTLCSLLIEWPSDRGAGKTCEEILRAAGLQREWHDPLGQRANQVWTRQPLERQPS